jgi:branched-chain amino acid transport system permease protein
MDSVKIDQSESWAFRIAMLLLAVTGLLGVMNDYALHLIIVALILAILCNGLNVAFGSTGQLLLCQAAFFGFGAYVSSLLVMRAHFSVWLAWPVAWAATVVLGLLTGLIASRTVGHYFAMFTMSLAIVFHQIVINWESVTQGALGLRGIRHLETLSALGLEISFERKSSYFVLCVLLVWLSTELVGVLRRTRIGRQLAAIREDEVAAASLGIRTSRLKVLAVALSAAAAGVAGPLYAHYRELISPSDFSVFQSVVALLIVIIGGSNTISGPLIGAFVVTFLPELLRPVADFRWVLFGGALIVCALFFPGGISGAIRGFCLNVERWKT